MAEKKRKEKPDVDFGLGGIFKGLGDLVEKLGDLAEKGKEIKKEGGFTHGDTRGVYGFSVRTAGPGGGKTTVEPFGNIKKDEKGEPTGVHRARTAHRPVRGRRSRTGRGRATRCR